jgi:hypothetical protein
MDTVILWVGRQWQLTGEYLELKPDAKCVDSGRSAPDYWIKIDALDHGLIRDRGWAAHMAEKSWVDVEDFCKGFLEARAYFNFAPLWQVEADIGRAKLYAAGGSQ